MRFSPMGLFFRNGGSNFKITKYYFTGPALKNIKCHLGLNVFFRFLQEDSAGNINYEEFVKMVLTSN